MRNLLKETIEKLSDNGISQEDVRWIGNERFWSTWENFKEISNEDYDNGFGAAHVAQDLVIVGDDWWMTRGEYDGSEWWDFHRKPMLPPTFTKIDKVVGNKMWVPLSEYNPSLKTEEEQEATYWDEDVD